MDSLRIQSRVGVPLSSERVWELVGDLDRWSQWNPVETAMSGTIAFGGKLTFVEHIEGLAPRPATVRLADWQPEAQLVWAERRGFLFNTVRYFEIEQLSRDGCVFSNGFLFSGLRGELFHDRHRKALRQATEATAQGLLAALAS